MDFSSWPTELSATLEAIKLITRGNSTKCEVNNRVKVYKVPSNNPNKYTIRVDIKVQEDL